jgi:hypothetical protein
MTEISRPWQSTTPGDAGPYSAGQWQTLYQNIIGLGASRANVGVFLGSGTQPNDGLKVQAKAIPTTSIDVLAGAALVQGIAYINSATVSFVIAANGSGNPRIDTVVLQADYALQTVRLAVLQGTAAGSPVPPTLTQTANVLWEIPLADIAVANGFATITNANITIRREWVNAPSGVYLDSVLNNSGVTLEDGDVVIWDSTADRAITLTTTAEDKLLAGVWRGRTAAAGYGRVQVRGIGYVNGDAAITRGARLVSSATTSKAGATTGFSVGADLGLALETTAGASYLLAYINVTRTALIQGYQPVAAPFGYSPGNAYSSSTTLAALSGTILIPITLAGPMLLQAVSILNNDVATQRTWRWDLYADLNNNVNAIPRVATCSAAETFTPGAASMRTIAASGAPVYLPPGAYYLAIQNTHATSTFALGTLVAGGNYLPTTAKTKTTGGANGATLDIIAATWTAVFGAYAANLRGRAAGDTVAW